MAELPGFTKSASSKPTVGRVVHLFAINGDGPFAATVTEVGVTVMVVFLMPPGSPGRPAFVSREEGAINTALADERGNVYCWRWPAREG